MYLLINLLACLLIYLTVKTITLHYKKAIVNNIQPEETTQSIGLDNSDGGPYMCEPELRNMFYF